MKKYFKSVLSGLVFVVTSIPFSIGSVMILCCNFISCVFPFTFINNFITKLGELYMDLQVTVAVKLTEWFNEEYEPEDTTNTTNTEVEVSTN